MPGMESSEDLRPLRRLEGPPDLGEHVERVLVTGVMEGSVPGRLLVDQAAAGCGRQGTEERRATVDGQGLGGHPHIGIPVSHELGIEIVPIRIRLSGRDVQPFDDHRAVEPGRVGRSADQDPRSIRSRCRRCDGPFAVTGRRCGREGSRRPGGEELLLDVAIGGQVERQAGERLDDVAHRDGTGQGGLGWIGRLRRSRDRSRLGRATGGALIAAAGTGHKDDHREHPEHRVGGSVGRAHMRLAVGRMDAVMLRRELILGSSPDRSNAASRGTRRSRRGLSLKAISSPRQPRSMLLPWDAVGLGRRSSLPRWSPSVWRDVPRARRSPPRHLPPTTRSQPLRRRWCRPGPANGRFRATTTTTLVTPVDRPSMRNRSLVWLRPGRLR